ncbi:MAG: S8 family serine peptidase [Rhodospirillaceae bacterium]|nr:S8 family serine peptidase [Rhodospirillaceae bacterium]
MIGRPLAAVIGLFFLGFAVPTIAQDPISEIKARIADKGQATVLVRMDVAESASLAEPAREGAAVQSDTTPRDRLNRVREGIASRRSSLESSMAAHGIKMQRTYENLPFFVTTVDEAGIEILLRDPGVTSVTLNRARRVNRDVIRKVILSDSELAAQNAAANGATPEQVAAERMARSQVTSTSTPSALATPSLDTSVGYINADQVWTQGFIGSGQAIAILDDGIDANHDMFDGKIVAEACFSDTFDPVDESLCANGNDSQIGFGSASLCPSGTTVCEHGSHVAGIAAGNDQTGSTQRRGVAYGADLIPIQVFTQVNDPDACDGEDSCELSYDSATIAALNHVINLTDTFSIAAANMSLGSELTDTACDNNVHKTAIDTLRGLGVLTAISAGNTAAVGSVENPGCISTALTVSSVIISIPDSTVNHAPMVDVLAPGVFIVSAVPNNSYASFSGTSMATPHAAGAVALLKSANPNATADEIETALESTGVSTTLEAWSWNTPLIDVEAALSSMGTGSSLSGRVIAGAFASNRTSVQSNIRFYNSGIFTGTAFVDVVDDLTGQTVGTYSRDIPGGASIQVSMEDIENGASPAITPAGGDTQTYTLHVTASFSGYTQHVLWNPAGGSLTNISGCGNGLANTVRDIGNVHTSIINGYPSYMMVYNSGSTAAAPTFVVRDARDGSSLGNFTFSSDIAPNTTATVLVSDLVEFFGGTPESDQFHLNLELQNSFSGFAQHIVDNEIGGVLTNMTAKCDL